ncbi:glycosyltransferase family 39 protein [Chryseobacterium koreense]|uniref:glycosyltransferase family 39 protein n=1 Tax=Chryseobacterium koreense TaxID=232216 RepID=UPI0026ED8706|nr:glycosyltransferase family 39 protein [Chryseobacterium koreense]
MKRHLILLLLIFTTITGGYFLWSWSLLPDGERFIYPLDDAYIHLAIAKNFALNGAWSINSTGFDSASSSILYTLLLSTLIKIFGVWEFYPLIINIVAGYLAVYWFYRYFRDFYSQSEMVWAVILLLPFSLLYAMTLIGMEHTIHMFLMVLAVYWIHKNVDSNFDRGDFIKLLIIVFFISIIRFESMFFTAALAFALFLRRNFRKGFLVCSIGFFPILIFGLISIQSGGFFFPNSVFIKTSVPSAGNLFFKLWILFREGILLNASFYKCLFFPFLLTGIYLIKKYRGQNIRDLFQRETLIITIVSVGFMHALFSILKYRYENYLMISLLLVIIPIISDFFKNLKAGKVKPNVFNMISLMSILGIFAISVYRFQYMHRPSVVGSRDIFEQQVEMSRFLGEFYRGEKVVANDIGAISYFSGVRLLDMVGLGSTDVAKMILENKDLPAPEFQSRYRNFLTEYSAENNYQVAVIYPKWFPGDIPSTWIPVASWTNPDNRAAAQNQVVFYALKPGQVKKLQQNLRRFDRNKNVVQRFYIKH